MLSTIVKFVLGTWVFHGDADGDSFQIYSHHTAAGHTMEKVCILSVNEAQLDLILS